MLDRLLKLWKKIQLFLDISSGAALGSWTILALYLAASQKMTAEFIEGYKAVLYTFGAYTVSRAVASHPKITKVLERLWTKQTKDI